MGDITFATLESLNSVKNVIKEADKALNNKKMTMKDSSIPDAVGAAVGMGAGGASSFAALYLGGTTGLSAAGITSGLATAGSIVGGGMAAGIGVLVAPVAVFGVAGYALLSKRKSKRLRQEKEKMIQMIVEKQDKLMRELKDKNNQNKKRLNYLEGINNLLASALKDLQQDLATG